MAQKNATPQKKQLEAIKRNKLNPALYVVIKELENKLLSSLGRKVKISNSSKKKVIERSYDNDEDLEALLLSLCGQTIFDETAN